MSVRFYCLFVLIHSTEAKYMTIKRVTNLGQLEKETFNTLTTTTPLQCFGTVGWASGRASDL